MADEDMDEQLLQVIGRGSKAAAGKRRRKADSDDEDEPAVGSKRGKPVGDNDDDVGMEDMDEEERAKLGKMSELDREMYLYERAEQLQRAKLGKSVLDQTRSRDAEQVEVRASSRRPRTQTGTDSAIGKIAAAHAQREAREKKKQQEEEERQEKEQQRVRSRRRQQDEPEQQLPELPEEEEEVASEEDEEAADESDESDEDADMADLEPEEGDELQEGGAAALGARAETYDEGAGYEEAEEMATLEEIHSIQLKRSQLEAWHNEPFFEADMPGCVLRIVPNLGPTAPQKQQPSYMLVRVDNIVVRNSYAFPKHPQRTRKWLHLDDLTGAVFRHQMAQVSNGLITQEEYDKARQRAQRAGSKFITKGDVQQALEKLQHARSFKYDAALVKDMLQKKRAAGKLVGAYAQVRARLELDMKLAEQEGRLEDMNKARDELERLEQQQRARVNEEEELLAAAVEAEKQQQPSLAPKVKGSLALAMVNMRNRDKNAFKMINAPAGSALAKAAAATIDGSNTADVFSRRHTQSKVYWATGRSNVAKQTEQQQALQRTASGAAEVEQLKGSMRKMDPSELIKVLDLNLDMSRLPRTLMDLVPRRVLGLRWYQTAQRRQAEIITGRHVISMQEWRQRCEPG